MITTFTADKVYEVSEKILEQLKSNGLPEIQAPFIALGFLSLYAELVLLGVGDIKEEDDENISM